MLKVEENYVAGIPQTIIAGFAPRGLAWHWTAGVTGRKGAEATIRGFVNDRYTRNASYSILFWHEHHLPDCVTVAMWIVRSSRASHSMNPAHAYLAKTNSSREKSRFAEVRRILGSKANDPNAGCWSVSYCGMPADLIRDLECSIFIADVRKLAQQLINHPNFIIERPHFGHGWIQPRTRYEMDAVPEGVDLLIAPVLYGEAPQLPEGDMQYWKPVREKFWTAKGTVFYDGAGNRKIFTDKEEVTSDAESSDGRYRMVRYGGNEYLVVDARGPNKEGMGLEPVPGTRIPASPQFGFPPPEIKEVIKEVPTGITQDDVNSAIEAERRRIAKAEGDRVEVRIQNT